jgi:lysophospholipase L1-like esterase
MRKLFALLLSMSLLLTAHHRCQADDISALKQGNIRLIFVGDSITGQSRNVPTGYAHQFEAAVKATYPNSNPQIISLGGSGHSVGSWAGIEKKSRDKSVILDIKTIDVHEELAKPADVLVIMLGMNDVLAPYVMDNDESIDKWVTRYQSLIDALKLRVTPHVLALAGITPCTEDSQSPKNQLIEKLNQHIRDLAEKNNARYLPTSHVVWTILKHGRYKDHAFHVTADYVHPTTAGHIGIAMGMLKGLGEDAAMIWLNDQRLKPMLDQLTTTKEPFSWEIKAKPDPDTPGMMQYDLYYWFKHTPGNNKPQPKVHAHLPEGWQMLVPPSESPASLLQIKGKPDHLQNMVSLTTNVNGTEYKTDIQIPAPWLVGYSFVQRLWQHPGYQFMADKAHTPIDDVIEAGDDFTQAIDMGQGKILIWQTYSPSINFTGGEDPSSVDFAAMLHANNFEAGYIARWIYSDKDRVCNIQPMSRMFAGIQYVKIYVNGKAAFEGRLRKAPATPIKLNKGWNTLVCRSSHHNWQWQLSLPITGNDGDDLSDLRYSIVPKTN